MEAAPNGIVVADRSGKIVMVNARAETLFGYPRDEFLQLKIEALIPQKVRSYHRGLREEYSKHPEVRAMGAGRDLYALRKDGSEFPVEIGLTPLQIDGSRFVLSSIVDISERKKVEGKLQQLAVKLQFQAEILKNVHDAVFFVNEEGVIQDWNEGAARIFRCDAEQSIGRSLYDLCPHTGTAHPFETRIKPAVESKGLAEEILRCSLNGGEEIFIRVRVTRMMRSDQSGYVFCASDITDRKRLEAELLQVAEEEQRKIGQDLHDDLCSQLSGIGCLTKVLEQQLKTENTPEAELMSNISEMIANAGVKAREIAYGLAPSVLENQGLGDALRDLAKRTRTLFGVSCLISGDMEQVADRLDANTTVQVYRIAQESITNAAKHSEAETIELIFTPKNDRLEMLIRDDGKGMSVDHVTAGMGLITMQRRAELIQADFSINASPGNGTSVRCSIPLL